MVPLWIERLCVTGLPVLVSILLIISTVLAILVVRKGLRIDVFGIVVIVAFFATAFSIIYTTTVDRARSHLPEIGRPLPPEPEPEPEELPDAPN